MEGRIRGGEGMEEYFNITLTYADIVQLYDILRSRGSKYILTDAEYNFIAAAKACIDRHNKN